MTRTPHTTLAIALLAALGVSGAAFAQVEAPRPEAEKAAKESRDEAVKSAAQAEADADAAASAANVAEAAARGIPAPTVEGEIAADANASVAARASDDAVRAAMDARKAATAARGARSAAETGADPTKAALEAKQAESMARQAGGAAARAAMTAESAAGAALDAVSPPPPVQPAPVAVGVATTQVVTVNSMPGDPVRMHFGRTDANGDGMVTSAEASAEAELTTHFARFDANADGSLTFEEYKEYRDWK